MRDERRGSARSRLAVLTALLATGLVIALAGSLLGVAGTLSDEPGASISVSEQNLTVSADGEEVTAVEEMANVTEVEISEQNGAFVVKTDQDEPLTDADRNRSVEIARQNATVLTALDDLDAYEFEVEPVSQVEATEASGVEFVVNESTAEDADWTLTADDGQHNGTEEGEEFNITVTESETDSSSETVRVDREPAYVEDRAVVTVREPDADESLLSAVVDLDEKRVVSVTDWREVGS